MYDLICAFLYLSVIVKPLSCYKPLIYNCRETNKGFIFKGVICKLYGKVFFVFHFYHDKYIWYWPAPLFDFHSTLTHSGLPNGPLLPLADKNVKHQPIKRNEGRNRRSGAFRMQRFRIIDFQITRPGLYSCISSGRFPASGISQIPPHELQFAVGFSR